MRVFPYENFVFILIVLLLAQSERSRGYGISPSSGFLPNASANQPGFFVARVRQMEEREFLKSSGWGFEYPCGHHGPVGEKKIQRSAKPRTAVKSCSGPPHLNHDGV